MLRLKCTKNDFFWGYAPDPAGGSLQRSPDPLAGFTGPTSKGGRVREGREGKGNARERKGDGKRERGRGLATQKKKFWRHHCI